LEPGAGVVAVLQPAAEVIFAELLADVVENDRLAGTLNLRGVDLTAQECDRAGNQRRR